MHNNSITPTPQEAINLLDKEVLDLEEALLKISQAIEKNEIEAFIQLIDSQEVKKRITPEHINLIIEQAGSQKRLGVIQEVLKRYTLDKDTINSYKGVISSAEMGNLEIFQFLLDYFDKKQLADVDDYARMAVVEALKKAIFRQRAEMIDYILNNHLIPNFGHGSKDRTREAYRDNINHSCVNVFEYALENNSLVGLEALIDNKNIEHKERNLNLMLFSSACRVNVKGCRLLLDKIKQHGYKLEIDKVKKGFFISVFRLIDTPEMTTNINTVAVCNIFLELKEFRTPLIINGALDSVFQMFDHSKLDKTRDEIYKKALQIFSKHIPLRELVEMVEIQSSYSEDLKNYVRELKEAVREEDMLSKTLSLIEINKKIASQKNKI